MGEVIAIISLSAILVALIIYHIVTINRYGKIMYDQQVDYMRMCDKHQESVDNYTELNKQYAESLDKHEKAFDEIKNKLIVKDAMLEAKDLQISSLENDVVRWRDQYEGLKKKFYEGDDDIPNFRLIDDILYPPQEDHDDEQ